VSVGLPRILRQLGVLMALCALLVGTGCTAGPSDRPAVAVRDADLPPQRLPQPPPSSLPPPPRGDYNPSSLNWTNCTDTITLQLGEPSPAQVDCGQLRVDADISAPIFGNSLELDLTRVGNGPAPLVVIAESTGEPGTVQAVRLAGRLPPAVLDAFTLIGLARRGTGPSQPLECMQPSIRGEIMGVDPDVRAPGQLETLLDVTRTAIQTCVQDVGELLTAINSTAAADDLEALRVALRAPVLNIVAHGEASRTVTDFLRRYPTSVGRVVLDGATDPNLDSIARAEAAMQASAAGFTTFTADCLVRNCPLAPDPRAALQALADSLQRDPLRVDRQWISGGTAYQAVLETSGTPERWAELATALAAARDGDGAPLAAMVAPTLVPARGLPARFDPALATHCNDTPTRVPPERARQLVEQWRKRSPLFGPLFAQRLLLCSAWPVPSEPPVGPGERPLPPVLVLATAGDPVTPVEGTRRTAQTLPSATLVTWQGHAHGALPRSPCMVDLVTRFLIDAITPASGTLCPP
jgi:pimeloyl-ACP methyl ester carboxylesterase